MFGSRTSFSVWKYDLFPEMSLGSENKDQQEKVQLKGQIYNSSSYIGFILA